MSKKNRLFSCFFIFISVILTPATSAECERCFDNLSHYEGMKSLNVDSDYIGSLVDQIVVSKGTSPSFEFLLKASVLDRPIDSKDTIFVLALFSSAIAETPKKGFEALGKYKPKQTYMDDLATISSSDELLRASYAWLINNTELSIPQSLIENYPGLIANDTPIWGATRDAYFSIDTPASKTEVFSSEELRQWRLLLDDLETPSKDSWLGSMRNAKFKREHITKGLLLNKPEYFEKHYTEVEPEPWLDYWRLQGAYEFNQHQRYLSAKQDAIERLAAELETLNKGSKSHSIVTATNYLNSIEKTFIYHDRFVSQYDRLFTVLRAVGWQGVVNDSGMTEESLWYAQSPYRTIGGYLLLNNPAEFSAYLDWLAAKKLDKELSEVLGFAAAHAEDLEKLLQGFDDFPSFWGEFNKNPLMYAAQYDNLKSVMYLMQHFPSLIEQTTLGKDHDSSLWDIPNIGDRTFVTYALEHASFNTASEVVARSPKKLLLGTDTQQRNILYYLAMNRNLSSSERKQILSQIPTENIALPNASFSCLRAESRTELLVCGLPEYAEIDRVLGATYTSKYNALLVKDDKTMLLTQQRTWISDSEQAFDDLTGTEHLQRMYKERIEQIQSFDNSQCRLDNGNTVAMRGLITPNPGWIRVFTEDGRQGIGYIWPETKGYFPCHLVWNLSSRKDFYQYAVMESYDHGRYASVSLSDSDYYLSLSRKNSAIETTVLGVPVNLTIDGSTYSSELDPTGIAALKNASVISTEFEGKRYNLSSKGSGATVIWLLENP